MSDSNGDDITNPDAAVRNLNTTLEATKTPSVGITTVSSTLTSIGISSTKIAHDNSILAAVVSSLVVIRFSLDDQKLGDQCTQLPLSFKGVESTMRKSSPS